MRRTDADGKRYPVRVALRAGIALAVVTAVGALGAGGADGADAPGDAPGDALGDARLFFAASERRAEAGGTIDAAPIDRTVGDVGSGTRPDGPSGPSGADVRVVARVTATGAADPVEGRARIGFEALMRVGRRVRIVVDGRPCRGTVDVSELQCDRLPDGIRSLALAADGRRLVVTLADGRRRHLAVGGALRP